MLISKNTKGRVIGEEGMDCGGLFRELYSLLLKDGEEFEGNNLSVNSKPLDQKRYLLARKAVATSILHGHPGPSMWWITLQEKNQIWTILIPKT